MIEFAIREMEEGDIPEVLEIEQSSFDYPWPESMFAGQLRLKDTALTLVAVSAGNVIGYVIVWFEEDYSHILNIAVAERWRGKKIADKILEEVKKKSVDKGCGTIYLEVRENNKFALEFYNRHGFRLIGKQKEYYGRTGESALILELVID
ncbi:MAG TPA: ribosomal protein S18-alanine N-acetyltransferase [Candidatus Krumholzibacteriaceae bacterium]|nr:ribosomal protein S18-alanine N-acetyltransferase [Candidatus Krumholzibacteriaceae bacterium]